VLETLIKRTNRWLSGVRVQESRQTIPTPNINGQLKGDQIALQKREASERNGLGPPLVLITSDPDVLALLNQRKFYKITIEEIV
jgi:hypothetical protein